MHDPEAVAGLLGGATHPLAALPGETQSSPRASAHVERPAPPVQPEALPWRDIDALLDRLDPLPATRAQRDPEPLTPSRGGALNWGPIAWTIALLLLVGLALVVGRERAEPPALGCPPAAVDRHPQARLKRAMLEKVLASERAAFGLPPG